MSRPLFLAGASLVALTCATPALADDAAEDRLAIERAEGGAVWRLSFGADYSSSETQFSETVALRRLNVALDLNSTQDVFSVPIGVSVTNGGLTLGADVAWISVESDLEGTINGVNVQSAVDLICSESLSLGGARRREFGLCPGSRDGLADVFLSGRYDFLPINDVVAFAVGADVKLPTASEEDQLGSGELDYSAFVEVGGAGRVAPYVGGGLQILGEPDNVEFDPVAFGYVGLQATLTDRASFAATFDYETSPTDLFDDYSTVSAAVSFDLTDRVQLSFSGAAGLSDIAPDAQVGIRLILSNR